MADRPIIGEMKSKPGNTPRTVGATALAQPDLPIPAPSAAPALRVVPSPEEKTPDPVELSPAEKYRERLKEAKIDLTDAHAIYDAVLDKGYYEEYVRIRTKRAVFRTRTYEDQLRLQTALELFTPKTHIAQEELISRYNLAASLFEWDGKPLSHESDSDFDAVLGLIKKMPQPVVALLYDALYRFDQKVLLVFSEGATDSF